MGGAISLPDRLTKLVDFPSSYIGHALKVARVKSDETGMEFVTSSVGVDPFSWARDWVNVLDYNAAGVITTTTLAAQLNSGSTSATLTDATSFAVGHGMAIPGAGVAGVELVVTLTDVTGNVVSWTGATSTTVSISTTVYHDDTQGFENALATGKNVYAPIGNYHTTWALEITTDRQVLAGIGLFTQNWVNGTSIYPRSLTDDVFHLYAASAPQLVGLRILHLGTPTAGAAIIVGRTGTRTNSARIRNVTTNGNYDGLIIRDGWNHHIENVAPAGIRRGIWINADVPEGGSEFKDIQASGLGASGVGIYIDGTDWNLWSMVNAYGTLTAIEVNSTHGQVYGQKFNSVYLDDLNGVGFKLTKGAYDCLNNSFEDLHMLIEGTTGIIVGAGVEHARFSGGDLIGIVGLGVDDSGTRSVFNDIHIRPAGHNTNSYDAFTLRAASVGAKITGCSGNYSRYGLVVEAGVTYATIQGNDFRNNNTGAASIAAGVKATCIIKDNQGLTDYLTSIAATPDFVGQEALSGGQFYKAIGTSSSADWKQTTI